MKKIINFFGGALFAYGLLSFLNSASIVHRSYIVTQLAAVQPNADPLRLRLLYLEDFDRETKEQRRLLFTAALGAGLACLRESKD